MSVTRLNFTKGYYAISNTDNNTASSLLNLLNSYSCIQYSIYTYA